MDRSGDTKEAYSHTDMASGGADTTGGGSAANRTDGTAAVRDGAASTAQAGMMQVVTMATHTASDTGSRSSQPTGPLERIQTEL